MIKELFDEEHRKSTITVIVSAIIALGLGTLFHFLYDLTSQSFIIGLFAPVNESVWEHLKLIFFPIVILMIPEYFIYGKDSYSFFTSKLIGIIIGLFTVITNYYTILGVTGVNSMAVNVSIFIISILLSYGIAYYKLLRPMTVFGKSPELFSLIILSAISTSFMIFTALPPSIPLFVDPESGQTAFFTAI